ncbi:WYL domain-containing protein [Evansella sp. AB-rgal1]|uniref:WYL domain-containing protein n=1 Tax=Evansella sp. AB-rgal1 TaxID=3242696 RepID=UPI00359CBDF5
MTESKKDSNTLENLIIFWDILYENRERTFTRKELEEIMTEKTGIIFKRKKMTNLISTFMYLESNGINFEVKLVREKSDDGGSFLYNVKSKRAETTLDNERLFEPEEAIMLYNAVHTSKFIPQVDKDNLLNKIGDLLSNEANLSIEKFKKMVIPEFSVIQPAPVFNSLLTIYEAINEGKQLSFIHCQYDINKRLIPSRSNNDSMKKVNPYKVIVNRGHYYLYCTYPGSNHDRYFRIDRIKNVNKISTNIEVSPTEHIKDKVIDRQVYMFGGDVKLIRFRCEKDGNKMIGQLIDFFGTDRKLVIRELDSTHIEVEVNASIENMRYWLLQYITVIDHIRPKELEELIIGDLKNAIKRNEEIQ